MRRILTIGIDVVLIVLLATTLITQLSGTKLKLLFRNQHSSPKVFAARSGVVVDLATLPVLGSEKADLGIIEFSDFQCPYCAAYAINVLPHVQKEFIETGKIRYAFANNPLAIHPDAQFLASAAVCARGHDRFWEMHHELFRTQPQTLTDVMRIAETLRLDGPDFRECLDDNESAKKQIDADVVYADQLNLQATPSFVIGELHRNKLIPRKIIMGSQPISTFEAVVYELSHKS